MKKSMRTGKTFNDAKWIAEEDKLMGAITGRANQKRILCIGRLLLIIAICVVPGVGQQTNVILKGQVMDEFGAVIVGATVTAVNASGMEKSAQTNGEGAYTLTGLAPGKYLVRASAKGFANYENAEVELMAGRSRQLNITLKVTIEQQKVTVTPEGQGLSTEPENNLGAIVLKGADLESLPEDPDDLAAALQALAGPSSGPNGGQIFIDGFTGGRLPPLASIREIRINANPFSAEYDRLGFGRIEIFTKPGTDKFRGQASFSFNNQALNARNPFAPTRAPYLSRQYGGNLSGPISKKKASLFIDFEKRDINDDAVINATVLDPNLKIVPFSQLVATANRRTTISPRIDYQLNSKITLVGRYTYTHSSNVTGVGGFSLAMRTYPTASTEQTGQLTTTAVINKHTVNETRFQFIHQTSRDDGNNSVPTINVQDAFTGGGSQVGLASNEQNRWELSNVTSLVLGNHTVRFGARLRDVHITSVSPQNFGGTWTFAGGFGPELDANNRVVIDPATGRPVFEQLSSLERYRRTLLFQQKGLSALQIRALGGGATQLTISAGNPTATVGQWVFGAFVQDDWKARPNLTVNMGLRYENQDNIPAHYDFAPRFGFAWAPGPANPTSPSKTVIRGGFGIFYDRINESLTLTANRLNGTNQEQFIVTDPVVLGSFPNVPSVATLAAFSTPITIYQLAKDIRAPYTMQSAISVERQLPHRFTMSATFISAHTRHLLRSLAINAPLPGTFDAAVRNNGVRPFGNANNIFEYESNGRFDQNQFVVGVSNRLSRGVSFNAFYVLAKADSDTDGAGTFPANSYDLSGEYGRSSLDIRHRFVATGSFRAPWRFTLSPFVIVSSGAPFNITIGRDLNGDTLFTERPGFVTDLSKPGVIVTPFGAFDPNPTPGEQIIPRNFAQGPGSVTLNLRVSKTFGFGGEGSPGAASGRGGGRGEGNRGLGGLRVVRGIAGAGRGGGGGHGGGGGDDFGGSQTTKRYNLAFSVNFQNLLNHANLGRPIGNLSSPLFGISTSSAGNFAGFGAGRGGGGTPPYNRLIEAQIRFSF